MLIEFGDLLMIAELVSERSRCKPVALNSKTGVLFSYIKHCCPVDTTSTDNVPSTYIWQNAESVKWGESSIF